MIQTCRCDYFINSFNSHMLRCAILLCANCLPVPLLRFSWIRPVRLWSSLSSPTQSLGGAAVLHSPLLCSPDPCSYRRTPVADAVVRRLLKEAPDDVPPQVHYLRLFPECLCFPFTARNYLLVPEASPVFLGSVDENCFFWARRMPPCSRFCHPQSWFEAFSAKKFVLEFAFPSSSDFSS